MICAVCLNPCLDKSASLPRFQLDAPNRIAMERMDVGGKGVNVARVIKELGGDGLLVGFDYQGGPIERAMEEEKVPCRLQRVPGALRVNMKLRETETGRTLEINEQGAEISGRDMARMEETLLSLIKPGDYVSLSGSLPYRAPRDAYARLCRGVKEKGAFAAVDCDGEALAAALAEKPDLIKPNAQEFRALTGADPLDRKKAVEACREMLGRGMGMVCLSLGSQGALLISKAGAWTCPAAPVPVLGAQGAGDSMLAALLVALSQGRSAGEALRFASAAAGASVSRPGTLLCQRADTIALMEKCCVRQVL